MGVGFATYEKLEYGVDMWGGGKSIYRIAGRGYRPGMLWGGVVLFLESIIKH